MHTAVGVNSEVDTVISPISRCVINILKVVCYLVEERNLAVIGRNVYGICVFLMCKLISVCMVIKLKTRQICGVEITVVKELILCSVKVELPSCILTAFTCILKDIVVLGVLQINVIKDLELVEVYLVDIVRITECVVDKAVRTAACIVCNRTESHKAEGIAVKNISAIEAELYVEALSCSDNNVNVGYTIYCSASYTLSVRTKVDGSTGSISEIARGIIAVVCSSVLFEAELSSIVIIVVLTGCYDGIVGELKENVEFFLVGTDQYIKIVFGVSLCRISELRTVIRIGKHYARLVTHISVTVGYKLLGRLVDEVSPSCAALKLIVGSRILHAVVLYECILISCGNDLKNVECLLCRVITYFHTVPCIAIGSCCITRRMCGTTDKGHDLTKGDLSTVDNVLYVVAICSVLYCV